MIQKNDAYKHRLGDNNVKAYSLGPPSNVLLKGG